MGGIPAGATPNQWWRFITPLFLHAGFIHIGVNLLLQLKLGGEVERELGPILFPFIYLASGISGFLLGGNFSANGVASTGASGALFGIIALDLLDLLFNWQLYESPKRNLLIHIVEIIVCFVIGLLPGIDNFAHIGGFAMGILLGTAVLRSPLRLRSLPTPEGRRPKVLRARFDFKNPGRHLQNRKRMWYVWGAVRVAAVVLAIVYFVMLIKNFENGGSHCSWCKYLSCLPVNGWCDQGDLTTSTTLS
jgi:membrane associated rhomboid family serine protease